MQKSEEVSIPGRSRLSLEIALLVIFFGMAYVPFYPFQAGDSYAPDYLRMAKYMALLGASALALRKVDLRPQKTIGVIFCVVYGILSVSNSAGELSTFSTRLLYVAMAITLFLMLVHGGMKELFESRFQLYLTISCLFSIALLLFWPELIVWKGDLKVGMPSISGFLDSTNRFAFLLVLGLSFSYGKRGILQFLLGALYMALIPFTGSFGAVLSAMSVVVFSLGWALANDRRNSLLYCKYAAHVLVLIFSFYYVFVDSTLFNQLFLRSAETSNSLQNRLEINERLSSLPDTNALYYVFGWPHLSDTDSFVVNVFQNGGLLSFGLFLCFVFAIVKTLVVEVKSSSLSPYLLALVISLELLYNNSFWSFPFLLVALLVISIFIVHHRDVRVMLSRAGRATETASRN